MILNKSLALHKNLWTNKLIFLDVILVSNGERTE